MKSAGPDDLEVLSGRRIEIDDPKLQKSKIDSCAAEGPICLSSFGTCLALKLLLMREKLRKDKEEEPR